MNLSVDNHTLIFFLRHSVQPSRLLPWHGRVVSRPSERARLLGEAVIFIGYTLEKPFEDAVTKVNDALPNSTCRWRGFTRSDSPLRWTK